MQKLYIIAGCNGAGKTTASYTILPDMLRCNEFVNADEIARGLSPFNPESMAIEAGRLMLRRMNDLLNEGADFAFETTLSTRTYSSSSTGLTLRVTSCRCSISGSRHPNKPSSVLPNVSAKEVTTYRPASFVVATPAACTTSRRSTCRYAIIGSYTTTVQPRVSEKSHTVRAMK